MASAAQIAANKANSLRSTGPRSPEGRARSSANAITHGLRSKKVQLFREESHAFEERLRKWMTSADAQSDTDEFLVYQNVCLSFDLDRVQRVRIERCTSLIENAEDDEIAEAQELGKRLFFDPAGPTPLYGNLPAFRGKRKKTSWNAEAVDLNDPAALVRMLCRNQAGCDWLHQQWVALRELLDSVGFWQSHDRFKAIRLLGLQPVDAIDDRRVAEIFVASHRLKPVRKNEFDDLLSDIEEEQRDRYRKRLSERWPDLFCDREEAQWRQILVDLADRNIERLSAKLEVHEENADVYAERTFARLSFDPSPEGQSLRNFQLKCTNALFRGMEHYRKHKAGTGGSSRGAVGVGWERKGRDGSADIGYERQQEDASTLSYDGSYGPPDGHDDCLDRAVDPNAWADQAAQSDDIMGVADDTHPDGACVMVDNLVADGLAAHADTTAPASVGLINDCNLTERAEPGPVATEAEEISHHFIHAVGVASHQDARGGRGEIRENATNEAIFDESIGIPEAQNPVDLTANSCVDSGLDKELVQPGEASDEKRGEVRELNSELSTPRAQKWEPDGQVRADCARMSHSKWERGILDKLQARNIPISESIRSALAPP